MNIDDKKNRNKIGIAYSVFVAIFSLLILTIRPLVNWFNDTFGVSIEQILYTISSPLKGADTNFLNPIIKKEIKYILIWGIFLLFWCVAIKIINDKNLNDKIVICGKRILAIVLIVGVIFSLVYMDKSLGIARYLYSRINESKIYEEYYVDPNDVAIDGNDTKNLICIYMESMETTYASREVGGAQEVNYIPNLTNIANENVSFSNSDKLGGWRPTGGTGWTMAAMFATTTGLPFSFPIEGNSMGDKESFAGGVTALGDILREKGYNQEFICGSDVTFAGRAAYFSQHGAYNLYDYYSAIDDGYIPKDRWVWWGYEDQYLYEIAKDRIQKLAAEDEPFNITMLTVDTHHVSGYMCDLCEDEYPDQLANVLVCADKQIQEFLEWCKSQDFYKDTVIVVMGDHPRMDTDLVDGIDEYDRTVYNVFLNVDDNISSNADTKNREFSAVDMYPTILSSMGFNIEGNRLGLGADLFSDEQTLIEKMGYENYQDEICKYSSYYVKRFE